MKKPIILVRGGSPDCIHVEHIIGEIGTCQLCGQVRDYGPCLDDMKDEILVEKGRKGGLAYAALYSD